MTELRDIAVAVARAVAMQARQGRLDADMAEREIDAAIAAKMWTPHYLPYRRAIEGLDEG